MLIALFLLLLGLVSLISGAEFFIRGGAGIGRFFNIPEYIVGSTIIAMGTSLPEVFTASYASITGNPLLSLSNILGSNIFNIALVLGIASMIYPVSIKRNVVRRDSFPFIFSIVILFIMAVGGTVSRFEGILLLLLMIGYTTLTLREREKPDTEFLRLAPSSKSKVFTYIILGMVLLYIGSQLAVDNAVNIARSLGVSQWIIGITIMAMGTSLPEFTTSIIAFFKGRGMLGVGNVIGSNIINIFFALGVTSFLAPVAVSNIVIIFDLPFIFLLSVVALYILRANHISRRSGFILFCAFLIYLVFSFMLHKA